jgi:hypothetical protein
MGSSKRGKLRAASTVRAPVLFVGKGVGGIDGLAIENVVDEKAVHVRPQQIGANEVAQAEGLKLLACDKFVIIKQKGLLVLLQLISDGIEVLAPAMGSGKRVSRSDWQ